MISYQQINLKKINRTEMYTYFRDLLYIAGQQKSVQQDKKI